MDTLTNEMLSAMNAHRAQFLADNPNLAKRPRAAEIAWRNRLTIAWLNDYPEQRGILRCVRNSIGIQEAFAQFREATRRDALRDM